MLPTYLINKIKKYSAPFSAQELILKKTNLQPIFIVKKLIKTEYYYSETGTYKNVNYTINSNSNLYYLFAHVNNYIYYDWNLGGFNTIDDAKNEVIEIYKSTIH